MITNSNDHPVVNQLVVDHPDIPLVTAMDRGIKKRGIPLNKLFQIQGRHNRDLEHLRSIHSLEGNQITAKKSLQNRGQLQHMLSSRM